MPDELNLTPEQPISRFVQEAVLDRSDNTIFKDLVYRHDRDEHQYEAAISNGVAPLDSLYVQGNYCVDVQTRTVDNEVLGFITATDLRSGDRVAQGIYNYESGGCSGDLEIEINPDHKTAIALAFMPVDEQAILLAQIEREKARQAQPTTIVSQIEKDGLKFTYGQASHRDEPLILVDTTPEITRFLETPVEPVRVASYLEDSKQFGGVADVSHSPISDHISQQLKQSLTEMGLDVSVEPSRYLPDLSQTNLTSESVVSQDEPDLSQLPLGELFKQADAIGDKYLTPEEIKTRDETLANAFAEVNQVIAEKGLTDVPTASPDSPAKPIPSPTTKPTMETTVKPPVPPAEVKPVALDALLSQSSQDAMRGITGMKSTYNPTLNRKETEPRSPGESFRNLAQGAYGAENFCKQHDIPVQGSADYIINKSALELDIPPEFKEKILSGINREECIPAVQAASGSDLPVWKRVAEQAPGTYEAKAPEATKSDLANDSTMLASAKAATLSQMGVTLKPREPEAQSKAAGYDVAPNTPATQQAVAFRDNLSASNIREWETAVRVAEPFNTDKIQGIQDFGEKFQRTGYQMSDGGISEGMATRLGTIEQTMKPDVTALRDRVTESVQSVLSQVPEDAKGKRTVEAPKLGLKFQGDKEGNFTVKALDSGKLLALCKDGEMTINRLPAPVITGMESRLDVQKSMQQSQGAAKAAPAKKAPTAGR